MPEINDKTRQQTWLLRYIVTAETAVIIMLLSFYATGYTEFLTKDDISNFPYPYLAEKEVVSRHITKSERALTQINDTLQDLNTRISNENHAVNLRITLLEKDIARQRR